MAASCTRPERNVKRIRAPADERRLAAPATIEGFAFVLPPRPTHMQTYLDFMRHVRDHGHAKDDRTGTGTLSVFGYQMRFDLAHGFPLLTTKRVHTKSIIHELLWFLQGDTNIAYLKANGVTHLGRMGRRQRRPRPRVRRAVALLADPRRDEHRPARGRGRRDQAQSGFAAAHRVGAGTWARSRG